VEVVASLSQGRTAAAQCGLFTHKSVPVIFEPPCIIHLHREIVETTMKMILVAVTMIFWVSMMSNYIMVANFGM